MHTWMRIKKIHLFPLFCFGLLIIHPVYPQGVSFEDWGIGIMIGPDQNGDWEANNSSISGLVLFDNPNGMPVGKFVGLGGAILSCEERKVEVDRKDYREYGYETVGLTYWEEREGYLKLLIHSEEEGFWIKKSDALAHGWKAHSWMSFFGKDITLFPECLGIRMNLRSEPRPHAQLLVNLSDDRFFINPTGNTKGLWAEVEVTQYNGPYCSGDDKILNSWKGWIKLLDDKGHPNLWFYTRGC